MASSIARTNPPVAPAPRRPVLRPLADVLPDPDASAPIDWTPPPAPPPPLPDPLAHAMAERVLRGAVEIVAGRRPAHQLAPVLRPALLDYLLQLRIAAAHLGPRVRTVRSQQPADGVLETVAVVVLRTGVRAICARFEQLAHPHGARWRCTALHFPLTRGDLAPARRR